MRDRRRIWALPSILVLFAFGLHGPSAIAQEQDPNAAPDAAAAAAPAPDPPSPAFPLSGPVLRSGSSGSEVELLQRRLLDLRYDPGAPDGGFGQATQYAVWAFQKVQGLPVTGRIGDYDRAALANPFIPAPQRPDLGPDRVVVDLTHQLLYLYHGGALDTISHISSGNGEHYCVPKYNECRDAITPVGDFTFMWYHAGWDHGPLGDLWNPLYFTSAGHAVHGSQSVPLYPASHGCVRIPMHIADRFPTIVGLTWPIAVMAP